MKKYYFIYLDSKNNEVQREKREYFDIKDARKTASYIFWNTSFCDVKKIKVIRIY